MKHSQSSSSSQANNQTEDKKYTGVRKRSSGRYSAQIRDPYTKRRRWLGTFDTAEDAAYAYDFAANALRGSRARTNLVHISSTPYTRIASNTEQLPGPGISGSSSLFPVSNIIQTYNANNIRPHNVYHAPTTNPNTYSSSSYGLQMPYYRSDIISTITTTPGLFSPSSVSFSSSSMFTPPMLMNMSMPKFIPLIFTNRTSHVHAAIPIRAPPQLSETHNSFSSISREFASISSTPFRSHIPESSSSYSNLGLFEGIPTFPKPPIPTTVSTIGLSEGIPLFSGPPIPTTASTSRMSTMDYSFGLPQHMQQDLPSTSRRDPQNDMLQEINSNAFDDDDMSEEIAALLDM